MAELSFRRPDQVDGPLYILTTLFNPMRYRMRWALYEKFRHMVDEAGAPLYTVEIAFGDRAFVLPEDPLNLRLRTSDILWHKERALNLLERQLPRDWKYLAWVDADVAFCRTDWVGETLQQLQIYPIVQAWSEAVDLSYDYQILARHQSFAASYRNGVPPAKTFFPDTDNGVYAVAAPGVTLPLDVHPWHPGFAWAITRQAWEDVGGLLDIAILGAADNHQAKSLVSDGAASCHPDISQGYRDEVLAWQTRARRLQRNLGLVNGLITHAWHGAKINRAYWDRWRILVEEGYDPHRDLEIRPNGLYGLRAAAYKLRDRIIEYFAARDEDNPG